VSDPRTARPAADLLSVLAAGAGLALAFPPLGAWPLAWLAPAPVLVRAARTGPRRALGLGCAWGVIFFTFSLYWTHGVMVRYGQLAPWLAAGPAALLIGYCSLYFGAFLCGVSTAARRWGEASAVWISPALFTALELLRGRLFGGFPWATLAMSQADTPATLAPAAWIGASGVGTLIALSWAAWARLAAQRRAPRRFALLAAWAFCAAALFAGGSARVRRLDALPADLRVGLVQVNVPQAIKWSAEHRLEILQAHRDLTREAVRQGARLVVWPESSLPFSPGERLPEEARGRLGLEEWVGERSRENGVEIVWGGTAAEPTGGRRRLYNSAFLSGADGRLLGRYDKQRLVPFGEYVPLRRFLPFVEPLVRQVGEFAPGAGPGVQRAAAAALGPLVCYEILFAELSRRAAAAGADLLVSVTNDAWYGTAVMPHLHLAAAPLRAVENGAPLARAANTGISALVLPSGRIAAATALERRQVLVGDLPSRGEPTFYRRHGEVWGAGCAIIALACGAALALPRRRGARPAAHPPRAGEPGP
jgi:apolipoprotein N-acyltransferase